MTELMEGGTEAGRERGTESQGAREGEREQEVHTQRRKKVCAKRGTDERMNE